MTIPEIRYRVDKYDTTTKINKLTIKTKQHERFISKRVQQIM